ncbi:MAG: pyruvate, phosphate dikinase, partial [Bdellovibrio sp.]|nr:pyruvate, phosphate dikinase [Bdellovibrio sp.]
MHQNVNTENKSSTSSTIPQKFVYFFAAGEAEGNAGMKNILGGKGANLAEMTSLGIPVPPGFTISTEICTHYTEAGGKLPEWVRPAVTAAMAKVEAKIGK